MCCARCAVHAVLCMLCCVCAVLQADDELQYIVPLVIHGDDADAHRRRSFQVLTMSSAVSDGSPWDTKIVLYCVDNSRVVEETFDTLDTWVVFGLLEIAHGKCLTIDPWGRRIERPSGSLAGRYTGVLTNLKGDEKWLQKSLKLKNSWVSHSVCAICRATQTGPLIYTTFGSQAPHRSTLLSTDDFIREAVRSNAWIRLPGFSVSLVNYDYLHIVDLTIIPECSASALVELTRDCLVWDAPSADERLRLAYVQFVAACKASRVRV